MKQKIKQLMGILLSFALMLGLMPGIGITAYAATDTYTTLKNNATVVKFNNFDWYIIEDNSTSASEGTVTLLAADNSFGLSAFSDDNNNNCYSSSKIKTALGAMTSAGGAFADVADAIVATDLTDITPNVLGAKLYLLDTTTAQNLHPSILEYYFPNSDLGIWWLRSPGYKESVAACVVGMDSYVYGIGLDVCGKHGIRPALKLNLPSVTFSSESNTFSLKQSHTHDFTYSASGATITVTCSADNCPLPPSSEEDSDHVATLTIVAPTLTYVGQTGDSISANATLTGLEDFNAETGKTIAETDIMYIGRDGTTYDESNIAPTAAGNYTAKITVEEETASVNYEIAIPVTGVTLNPATPQTIEMGRSVSFTASIEPTTATDKTVMWSVSGTNDDAVTLYSDTECQNQVPIDSATDTLTVYARGITIGSATVTATSNADSTKSASCDVTVNASAAGDNASLKNTTTVVHFDNRDWYLIDYDSNTVTLLSKECVAASQFNPYSEGNPSNTYSGSTVETAVNTWYTSHISTDAQSAVNGNGMFLLSTAEAQALPAAVLKCPQFSGTDNNYWWLCSPDEPNGGAWCVNGFYGIVHDNGVEPAQTFGVRPAIKLDLSSVIFTSESNTFSVKPDHTHSFTYTASGATITAACIDGCPDGYDDTNKITLTLNLPLSLVYDGEAKEAWISINGYSEPAPANLEAVPTTIAYYASTGIGSTTANGNALSGAPIDLGDYVAQMTWGDQTTSVAFSIVTEYPLNIAGTPVDSSNKNDVFGDGKVRFTPADTANNTPAILELNGYSYSGEYGIDYQGTGELHIVLTGTNNISSTGAFGIKAINGEGYPSGLVFSGSGSLSASGSGSGISATANITFTSGKITAEGATGIESTQGSIIVIGGSVTATGTATDTSENGFGIIAGSGFNIESGRITASGNSGSISGTVKNAIAGTGWTNTDSTGTTTGIAISKTGQDVSSFKKVQFPHAHNFIYSGDSATIIATCNNDDNGCNLTDHKVTLTIVAPTLTYAGQVGEGISEAATLDGLDTFNIATDKNVALMDIKYIGRDGTDYVESSNAPTAVGKYTAKITVEGKTASVDYRIFKTALTTFNTPDFILPTEVVTVEANAFDGVTKMTVVDARNCKKIDAEAFKGTGVKQIRLDKNCEIDDTAFASCGTVYVFAPAGGETERFCNTNTQDGIEFVAID